MTFVAVDKHGCGCSFSRSNDRGVTLRGLRRRDLARSKIARSAEEAHAREPRLVRVVRDVQMPGGSINLSVLERRVG